MLKRHLILLFFLFTSVYSGLLAIGNQSSGARSLALGNAHSTLFDVWSANNNQAGLASVKGFSLGLSYENRFGLSELGLSNLNMAIPVKFGTFGLTVQQFGFSDYNENKFGVAYGKQLSSKVSLGAQVSYYLVSVAEAQTQNKDAIAIELGMQIKATQKFTIAAHVFNLTNSKIKGDFQERLPMILTLGMKYDFSKKVFTLVDIEKNIDLPVNFKAGIEYHPVDAFYFRGGLNTYDFHFTGGLGVALKSFKLDLGFSHQTYLGYVSQIALSYSIKK